MNNPEAALAHRDKIAQLLFDVIRKLDQMSPAELHPFIRNRIAFLLEELAEEERLLAFHAGEAVEPKAHNMQFHIKGLGGVRA